MWNSGVDGDWEDPSRWTPTGVPTVTDSVCIVAFGTYTVTLSSSQSIHQMEIGGIGTAAVLRLALPVAGVLRIGAANSGLGVEVRHGSEIVLDGTNNLFAVDSPAGLTNYGLVRVSNSCSCQAAGEISFDAFTNIGTLHLAGAATLTLRGLFTNRGIISVTAPFPATIDAPLGTDVSQESGSIVGTQYLDLRGGPGTFGFDWSGGTIAANANDSTKAVLRVFGSGVDLGNAFLSGRLDVIGEFGQSFLTGEVGAGVHLRLASLADHEFVVLPSAVPIGPYVIDGTLELAEDPLLATGHAITVRGDLLINNGRFKITGGQVVELTVDSVVNKGTLLAHGKLRLAGTGRVLRNEGSIVVGSGRRLEIGLGATYESAINSVMTGTLLLTNSALQGLGSVGDVTSVSGSIRPGSPVGLLTASSVTMDQTTGLTIDVGGTTPGTFDQLAITGQATYGGTLVVTNVAPFVGGACGQVLPIISDRSSGPRGAFDKFVGLAQPSLVNRWRTHNPARRFELVGYNPLTDVFVNQSDLGVTEGGSSASYTVCLGPNVPNADVLVTPASELGEVAVTPAPLTFSLATWLLPQTVTVSANDDATVDSMVTDTVTNVVTSADPAYDGAPAGKIPVAVTDDDGDADLAVTLGDVPASIVVGQEFAARYAISNAGPTLSTGATFTVPALSGFEYLSATGATCTFRSGTLTCQLAGIASGAQRSITLTLRALSAGTHANTLRVAGQQPDANAGNNSVVQQLTVN